VNGPIVSNSGPLIALAILDQLEILRHLFSSVLIPEAVRDEVEAGGKQLAGVANFRRADWIRVMTPSTEADPVLESLLDRGEAAVICVASQQGNTGVLIDERKARKVARDIYQLQVIGTAGVLVRGKREGLIKEIRPLFDKLQQEGYWIQETIVQASLNMAGESD
jgi:predicted nucleic acid-binding protein